MRIVSTSILLSLSLIACRDTSHGDDDVTPDTPPGEMTIQQVQSDMLAPGSPVELKGVVVTAIDAYGMKTGDIWVQEPEGGPYSGVHVYGAPLDQVATLQLGDVIDIKGAVKDEFALSSDMSGNTVTELKPESGGQMIVTKVSAGAPLTPQVVDALAIGQLATWQARAAEWEKWEGVLVQVTNVSALSAPATIGSDTTLEKVSLTGDVLVESALAALPTPKIAVNDCLGSVTGVVDYFFDYQILPRTTAEVVTGGTACPPPEATALLCTDGIDNDGNGYNDCGDFNCIAAEASCRTLTTISAIQTATTPPTGGVELRDVYVSAISFSKKNLWLSTSLGAAQNEGIYVYRGSSASVLPTDVVVGAKVTVFGIVEEGNNDAMGDTVTQIKSPGITVTAAPAGAPTALTGQQASALVQTSTGEPYESVLVTLSGVKVVDVGTSANFYVGQLLQGSTTFLSDDDILRLTSTDVGKCYDITGIWTYQVYSNAYGLLPISKSAQVACP